jgi:nitrite reductase (NADH) large subunit
MKKLVIVGSGMSAMKVVDEVLKIDPLMYQITIIGAETVLPYNRIMLLTKKNAYRISLK